jgi:hypothetical protein
MSQYTDENVLKRVLWLYGTHTLLANIFMVIGYYALPAGFLRDTSLTWAGTLAAKPDSAVGEFVVTLIFNLGIMSIVGIGLNLININGFPQGYFVPIFLGIISGLVLGTNSFTAIDLAGIHYQEGAVIGFTIGGLEMLGYVCLVSATVDFGLFRYTNWWQWNEKPTRVKNLKVVRLAKPEMVCLLIGAALIVIAAYRESFGVPLL